MQFRSASRRAALPVMLVQLSRMMTQERHGGIVGTSRPLCVRSGTSIVRPRFLNSGRSRFPSQGRPSRVTMDMRKEIRYRLDAPAVYSWEGMCGRRFHGEGITRDISVQGAFIVTATAPPPEC